MLYRSATFARAGQSVSLVQAAGLSRQGHQEPPSWPAKHRRVAGADLLESWDKPPPVAKSRFVGGGQQHQSVALAEVAGTD